MSDSLLVVSWNVLATGYIHREYYPRVAPEHLNPAWRIPAVVARAIEIGADVFCLQEVDREISEALERALSPLGYECRYAERGGGRPDGSAVFLKTETCRLESVERIYYDESPRSFRHIAQVVRMEALGMPILLLNTHLRWDAPGATLEEQHGYQQAKIALQILQRESRRAEILCGDFNATPGSALVQLFLNSGFQDPFAALPSVFTFNAGGDPRRIDYVLLRGPLQGEPLDVAVIGSETPLPSLEQPSDHLPLGVRIRRT